MELNVSSLGLKCPHKCSRTCICVCVCADAGVCVGAGVCGRPAVRLLDVSAVSDRWSVDGGRFGCWWLGCVCVSVCVLASTANLSLLDPGDSGDNATSHYSRGAPPHPSPPFFFLPSVSSVHLFSWKLGYKNLFFTVFSDVFTPSGQVPPGKELFENYASPFLSEKSTNKIKKRNHLDCLFHKMQLFQLPCCKIMSYYWTIQI